jgi:hypothetical protein
MRRRWSSLRCTSPHRPWMSCNSPFAGTLALTLLVGAVGVCGGGEVCLEADDAWGCCPCSLSVMDWVGYSTMGSPCTSLPQVPSSLAHYRSLYPEREHGRGRGLWSLSTSTLDPFDTVSRPSLETTLYFWLVDAGCGYGFANGRVALHADLPVVSYEPALWGEFQTWTRDPDALGGSLSVVFACHPCPSGVIWEAPRVIGQFRFARVRRQPAIVDSAATVEVGPWSTVKERFR